MDLHTIKVGLAIAGLIITAGCFVFAMYFGEGAIRKARKEDTSGS